MKKRMITLAVCTAVLLCGCSSTDKLTDAVKQAAEQAAQNTATKAPEVTATPGPKETSLAAGKKGTIGDWEFCVKKAETKKNIKTSDYLGYKPGKGNTFVVVTISVRNNGKEAATPFPRMGLENKMIQSILYYDGDYEYKPTQLLSYDKDLMNKKVQPLTTQKGAITYEVPKKVAKSMDKLTIKIGTTKECLIYSLK